MFSSLFGFAKVVGLERLGNLIFFVEPFAEVDQLAAFGAEGSVLAGKPLSFFLAAWAFDFAARWHRWAI